MSYGDLIFVNTSNGQDESHVNIPSPKAPAIIAVNKKTGKLVWEDNSVGERILHGQWSSPSVGKVGDTVQVAVGQGDGWVRGYEALTGKKLWEFDMNPTSRNTCTGAAPSAIRIPISCVCCETV